MHFQESKADPWTLIKKNLIDVDPSPSTCAPFINWSIQGMALQIVGIRTAADDNTAMVSKAIGRSQHGASHFAQSASFFTSATNHTTREETGGALRVHFNIYRVPRSDLLPLPRLWEHSVLRHHRAPWPPCSIHLPVSIRACRWVSDLAMRGALPCRLYKRLFRLWTQCRGMRSLLPF